MDKHKANKGNQHIVNQINKKHNKINKKWTESRLLYTI